MDPGEAKGHGRLVTARYVVEPTLDRVPLQAGIRSRLWALPQTIFRKTSAALARFRRLSVSRATHLPAMRAAVGLLLWLTPPPCPSVQPQSLPKSSLS